MSAVAIRKLDKGLPRIDMLAPALVARQRGEPLPHNRAAPETADRTLRAARRLLDEARRDREEAASMLADAKVQAAAILAEAEITAQVRFELKPNLPNVAEIIKATAERHGFTVSALLGPGRSAAVVVARYEAMALAHAARPDLNPSQLGLLFKRDRSSILHALAITSGSKSRSWR